MILTTLFKGVKTMVKPFGIPAWSGVKERIAKKIINSYGRDMFQRFKEFETYGVGSLVCMCDGLNSRVVEVEPKYKNTKRGRVLVDLDIITDRNNCSMYHCGVTPPISYERALQYRDDIINQWKDNDVWGFALRYSDMVINNDGTYIPGETYKAIVRLED